MTKGTMLRWWVWIGMLAGLGWLVATDRSRPREGAIAELPRHKSVPAQTAAPSGAEPIAAPAVAVRDLVPRETLIGYRPAGARTPDLFASRRWAGPPAPPAPPPLPQTPIAVAPPPPPFTFLGKRRDDQGWQVYLGRGDLALIVREGDPVEGGYRVESIKPPTLTLVRSDGRQQIAIGDWE